MSRDGGSLPSPRSNSWLAAPASAQTIHISTVGKSPAQVDAEVREAAMRLCASLTVGATFRFEENRACIAQTVAKTYEQASLAAPTKVAQR